MYDVFDYQLLYVFLFNRCFLLHVRLSSSLNERVGQQIPFIIIQPNLIDYK
jgi:hypothetical protein